MIVGVFLSYQLISSSFSSAKEEIICIKLLSTCEIKKEPSIVTKKVVKIEKIKQITQKRIKKVTQKSKPKKRVAIVPKLEEENSQKENIVVKKPILADPPKTKTTKEETISTPQVTFEEKYMEENLAKIVELLQENLYYPRRARKRGNEGEVIVSFKLSVDAEVTDVMVISSTSDVLSRGAIKTIENLSYKFPKPKKNLDLKVPIIYKLH